jgi:hypothetical protein
MLISKPFVVHFAKKVHDKQVIYTTCISILEQEIRFMICLTLLRMLIPPMVYHWIDLGYRTLLAKGFTFFYFDLDFLNGVQNSIALHAKIYLITNNFGGRQA